MRKIITDIIIINFNEQCNIEKTGKATITMAELRSIAENAALEILEAYGEFQARRQAMEDVSLDDVHHVSEYPDGWDTLVHIPKEEESA